MLNFPSSNLYQSLSSRHLNHLMYLFINPANNAESLINRHWRGKSDEDFVAYSLLQKVTSSMWAKRPKSMGQGPWEKDVCERPWEHKQEAFNSRNMGSKFLTLNPENWKVFCLAEQTTNKMQWQCMKWKKIFANYKSGKSNTQIDKELIKNPI